MNLLRKLSCSALVLCLAAATTSARAQEQQVSEAAAHHFQEGVRHLTTDSPDRYERAYREFKAAYRDSPSWKILGNLGIVAMELERDGEAMRAFEGYLRKGGERLDAQERQQFSKDLELLRRGHGTMTVSCDATPCWIVDERIPDVGDTVVNRYGPLSEATDLAVRAGHHRVRVDRAGFDADVWELDIEPGSTHAHHFGQSAASQQGAPLLAEGSEPAPPAPVADEGASQVTAYVTLAAGAVAAGAGGVLFALAGSKQTEADEEHDRRCNVDSSLCGVNVPGDRDARNLRIAGGVTAGLGLAAIGAGIYLLVVDDDLESSGIADRRLRPWIGLGSIGLSGTF